MMRSPLVLILVCGLAVASRSAVVVELGAADPVLSSRLICTLNGSSVEFDGGRLKKGTKVVESSLPGTAGSFYVALSATQKLETMDASKWQFGPKTANLDAVERGWGVCSDGEEFGAKQLSLGEAMLLRFDASTLSVPPDHCLTFSLLTADGQTYRVFRRTKTEEGELAAGISNLHTGYSPGIPVEGKMEFAITDAGHVGGGALRIKGISFDVVPAAQLTKPVLENRILPPKTTSSSIKKIDTLGLITY